jgi:hypothetical protein
MTLDKGNVPTEVLEMAKNSFKTLGMNFGSIGIAEYENKKSESKYLIIGSNTKVLTDLLDYCEYENLVKITKKAIEERTKFQAYEKVDSTSLIQIKEEKGKESDIDISTYKERSKIRKECIKKVSKNLQLSTKFYSQDYLAIINDDIFMVEFDMGINNSSSVSVCSDKGITFKILSLAGIPCVDHRSFILSENDEKGVMENVLEKFKE